MNKKIQYNNSDPTKPTFIEVDKMKIYVASSRRNKYHQEVVKYLRKKDFKVYDFKNPEVGETGFSWLEIDPDWLEWTPKQYIEALKHPLAEYGFDRDSTAMREADICVLVLPSGRDSHTEAGWMKGAGKKVFVYIPEPQEPELMYKIYDDIITDLNELSNILKQEKDK